MSANPDIVTSLNTVVIPAVNRSLELLTQLVQQTPAAPLASAAAVAKELSVIAGELQGVFEKFKSNQDDLSKKDKVAGAAKEINERILKARAAFDAAQPKVVLGPSEEPSPTATAGAQTPAADTPAAAEKAEVSVGVGSVKSVVDRSADRADMMPMDDFFETVSTSLMRAQAALNDRSLDYVSKLDPRFPPVYYGIPSVRAEMRVGFNKAETRGINLILFSNSRQKTEYGESVVSFEVVGTPPPPGPAAYGKYVVPVPRFLVVGEQRAEILRLVREDKGLGQTVYANAEESALVLRYERAGADDPQRYLVMWPAKKEGDKFDHWHTMAVVYAVEARGPGGELRLDYPKAKETTEEQGAESIFEFPEEVKNDVFTLNPDSPGKLASLATLSSITDKARLAKLAVNLGDVLMNVNLLLGQWLRAVEYKPKGDVPDEG